MISLRAIVTGIRILIPSLAVLLLGVWFAGQILQDRSWLCGLMFYCPTPALALYYLTACVVALARRSLLWKFYSCLLMVPLLWMLMVENQWRPPCAELADSIALTDFDEMLPTESSSRVIRLVHWNLCRPNARWRDQRELMRQLDPDIIVLSETTDVVKSEDFEGFDTFEIYGMLIACHGRMTASSSLVPGKVLNAVAIKCELDDGPLHVLIADMTSNLNIWRDPYLRQLTQAMADHQCDIVVGDLNSPRRSLALLDLPAGYQHAYDVAGAGWGYTWPVPAPVLAIDQCICGPGVLPEEYRLQSSLLSDHRIQILDFRRNFRD